MAGENGCEKMDARKYLIVMAAGHGQRMGGDLPKQFLDLDGKAILHHTIRKFVEAEPDICVVTVLPAGGDWDGWWKDYCIKNNFNCPQILVHGGITRFHSVKAALAKVPDGVTVAIQDGVRPLLSTGLISRMFKRFDDEPECRALIPVTPVVDTLKRLDQVKDGGGSVSLVSSGRQVDRTGLYGAQTPQMFRSEDIKAAYRQAYDTLFTDDASVAEKYEIPLTFIEGERLNFKITSPEDLVLAEAVIGAVRGLAGADTNVRKG